MATNVPTPDGYIQSFNTTSIPKTIGPPTLATLTTAKDILSECATSVPSNRGGGALGYLQLIIGDTQFNAQAGTLPWTDPPHPGPTPAIPVGSTGPQIAQIVNQHMEELREY